MEPLTAPVPDNFKPQGEDLQLPSIGQQLTDPLDQVTQQILIKLIRKYGGQLPIGSIYSNATNSANPSTYLGYGAWTAIEGVVIAGYKSGDPDFGTAGATIGASTHTLSISEMPQHSHTGGLTNVGGSSQSGGSGGFQLDTATGTSGDGDPHNNIQPTLVAYVWQRTA